MFVYNNMVHDARVRKEAQTLVGAGYEVTVVAVHDPGRTARRERVHGFDILRVSRSILGVSRREITAVVLRRPTATAAPAASVEKQTPPRRAGGLRALLETCLRLPLYPLRRALVFLRFLRAGLGTRAAVYHAHDLNTLLVAWVGSRMARARLVYDTHEVATDRADMTLRWWASLLERSLIGRADRVICTTQTRADFTHERYSIAPPTVLRNLPAYAAPGPPDLLHRRLGLPAHTRIALYQGGIQPERGLRQLLDAAPEIEGGVVVLLGSGRLKPALMARAADSGLLGTKVFFHDAVPVAELPHWTASAYVGLQLLQNTCFNHYSSLSNKLLEYIMAGVPVIASDLPEMGRVVGDSSAGILIDASEPKAIAQAINALLSDPDRRDRMAAAARAARRRYSWEQDERILIDLYAGLLDRRGGQSARG
jgi:glycosyltransferase involved in cell wall biosynthesis